MKASSFFVKKYCLFSENGLQYEEKGGLYEA